MKVIQFIAAALVAAPSAAFFAPVGTNSFVARQRVASRATTAVRMADASDELITEVIDVVGEQLDKKGEVKLESNFIDDLDADSLDTVELIMSLEEKFGMDIPEEDAQKMVCVKDAVDYISTHK